MTLWNGDDRAVEVSFREAFELTTCEGLESGGGVNTSYGDSVDALWEGERITYEVLPPYALRRALIRFSYSSNAESTPGQRSEARGMGHLHMFFHLML